MKIILQSLVFLFCLALSAQETCRTMEIDDEAYLAKLNRIRQATEQASKSQASKSVAETKRYVPIKSHIFRNSDGSGGLTMESLNKGLGMLNSYFKDINIEFYISGISPDYTNDDKFMDGTYTSTDEADYHNSNGDSNAINLYSVAKIMGASGYAYIAPALQKYNRIFVGNNFFTDDKTTPHEFGHFLVCGIHSITPIMPILQSESL